MADIIKNGVLQADDWAVLRLGEDMVAADIDVPSEGRWLVPLAVWQAQRDALLEAARAGRVAVWLGGDDEPTALAEDLPQLALVAVDFPKFADGRGYSIATLLRTRLNYRGELRAIGNVLRDQFSNMKRCGFDVLQPQPGRYTTEQLQAALSSLKTFSEPYQGAADCAEPLFRRRQREVAP